MRNTPSTGAFRAPIHKSLCNNRVYLFLKQAGPGINEQATGTTFKEVSGKEVALIPIPIPPLAEQYRIVAEVDELMDLLDRLEEMQERQGAAQSAYGKFSKSPSGFHYGLSDSSDSMSYGRDQKLESDFEKSPYVNAVLHYIKIPDYPRT